LESTYILNISVINVENSLKSNLPSILFVSYFNNNSSVKVFIVLSSFLNNLYKIIVKKLLNSNFTQLVLSVDSIK